MASFSDYYAAQQKASSGGGTKKSSGVHLSTKGLPASTSKKEGGQDFLSWLGDIISRPLYAVTNSIGNSMESTGKLTRDIQSGKGDIAGDVLNGIGASTVAPFQGLFGTDPAHQRTTSQLLEKASDTYLPLVDKNYVNTKNNVNPIAKGVVGFAGDMALDPLTYLPGPNLLSAGKNLVKGGKSVTSLLAKGLKSTDEVDKAAEKVVDTASKVEAPTKKSAVNAITEKLNNAETELAAKRAPVANDDLDAISYIAGKDRTPEQQLIVSDAKVADALKTPEAASAKSFLKDLSAPEVKGMAKAVVSTKNAKPLEYGPTDTASGWRDEAQQLSDSFEGKLSQMPKVPYKGKNAPIATVLNDAANDDPEAILALRTHHRMTYQPAFIQSAKQGKLIDAFGRDVTPKAPMAQGATETVSDAIGRFQQKMVEDDVNVRQQLGEGLVNNLARYANPEHFDKVVSKLSNILDGSADVHMFKKLDTPTKRMLTQIGIDPDRVPLGVRTVQRTKNAQKPAPYISPNELSESEKSVLAKMGKGSLSESEQLSEDSLRATGIQQFVEPHVPDSRFITTTENADALRTSKDYGEGDGLLKREFNTHANYTHMKAIGTRVVDLLKKNPKLAAQPRAFAHKDLYMPVIRRNEAKIEELGVPIEIGVGDERILLTPGQILDHLNAADRKTMDWSFWNSGTAVPPTNLLDAVVAAVGGHVTLADNVTFDGPEAVRLALAQTETRYASKAGGRTTFGNNLARIDKDGSPMAKPGQYGKATKTGPELVEQLASLIEREAPKLRAIADDNAAAWKARTGEEFHDLTDKELNRLREVFETATSQGSLIEATANIAKDVAKDASDIGATQKATNLTGVTAEGTVEPTVQTAVATITKTADKLDKAPLSESEGLKARSAQDRADAVIDQLHKDQPFVPGGATVDFGEIIRQGINDNLITKVRTGFDRSLGNKAMHEDWRKVESVWHTNLASYKKGLSTLQKSLKLKDDPERARQAYYNLQHGVVTADPATNQMAQQMETFVGQIFGSADPTKRALVDNGFLREGTNIERTNEVLSRFGLGDHLFDVDKATLDAAKSGRSINEELARQWRDHDVQDPIDYLSRMYTAFSKATADQTLVNTFVKLAHGQGGLSSIPKKGFSRVIDPDGKSIFAAYMPKDVYVQDHALRQIHVIDSMMRSVLKKQGPLWDFLNNYYVPLLDMWKWGNTLPNPTHHFRNFTGDTSLTYLANGAKGFRTAHKKALQAIASHNSYDGYDAVAALQGIHELPNAGKILTDGRLGKLSASDYYQAAGARGNLPSFQVLEQLETTLRGTKAPARAWEGLTSTKGAQVIGGISEARDHYVRLAHFIQFTEQHINSTKIKSLDDLLDMAAESTRKWHPDGSDLTNTEQYFKLIIPFYSWTRKAIPLIAESILTRPGRVNAFNKASYNLAVTTGVNPQSLSDPFPDDQVFPSYLADQANGPQFKIDNKYFGIDPGIPTWDVLNETVAGDPLKNILGQVNPLLKAPAEIVTGKNLATGGDIHDWSDYLDSDIPGLAQGARLTGVSPTGSIASLLQGKGLDPQYQVAKGNKQPLVSILNYLTGAGITPMSEANALSYAQFEEQQKGQPGKSF